MRRVESIDANCIFVIYIYRKIRFTTLKYHRLFLEMLILIRIDLETHNNMMLSIRKILKLYYIKENFVLIICMKHSFKISAFQLFTVSR